MTKNSKQVPENGVKVLEKSVDVLENYVTLRKIENSWRKIECTFRKKWISFGKVVYVPEKSVHAPENWNQAVENMVYGPENWIYFPEKSAHVPENIENQNRHWKIELFVSKNLCTGIWQLAEIPENYLHSSESNYINRYGINNGELIYCRRIILFENFYSQSEFSTPWIYFPKKLIWKPLKGT